MWFVFPFLLPNKLCPKNETLKLCFTSCAHHKYLFHVEEINKQYAKYLYFQWLKCEKYKCQNYAPDQYQRGVAGSYRHNNNLNWRQRHTSEIHQASTTVSTSKHPVSFWIHGNVFGRKYKATTENRQRLLNTPHQVMPSVGEDILPAC